MKFYEKFARLVDQEISQTLPGPLTNFLNDAFMKKKHSGKILQLGGRIWLTN